MLILAVEQEVHSAFGDSSLYATKWSKSFRPNCCHASHCLVVALWFRFHLKQAASLTDRIISKTMDILAVTKIWLSPHDTAACIADISPPGYTFHHRPRPVGRGGGVGFLISNIFYVNLHTSPAYTSFESVCVNIPNWCFSRYFICI